MKSQEIGFSMLRSISSMARWMRASFARSEYSGAGCSAVPDWMSFSIRMRRAFSARDLPPKLSMMREARWTTQVPLAQVRRSFSTTYSASEVLGTSGNSAVKASWWYQLTQQRTPSIRPSRASTKDPVHRPTSGTPSAAALLRKSACWRVQRCPCSNPPTVTM